LTSSSAKADDPVRRAVDVVLRQHGILDAPPFAGHDKRTITAPDLPAELKVALEARLHGLSRTNAAGRAALISQTYRDGGNSSAIRTATDALAYALARMPAT
jgi:hypothetical protein